MNTNKLWNTKLILEFRNPKIIKSTIGGILHPRLLWNLYYPNSDIKLRYYEKFRPESALIQKFMYKNVIFLIFNFTIWYILKRTPTYIESMNVHLTRLSNNGTACFNKTKGTTGFNKVSHKITVNQPIKICYFTAGNITIRQSIGFPMGIDPATFWTNLFLYLYEEEYRSSLISSDKVKPKHFYSTKLFIDHLSAINDGAEFGRFFTGDISRVAV